jgi:hypothetical protein
LAESAGREGQYPFAAVIASNGVFLCESANRLKRDHDVNSHAEICYLQSSSDPGERFYDDRRREPYDIDIGCGDLGRAQGGLPS